MSRFLPCLFVFGLCCGPALAQEKATAPAKDEKITFDQHVLPIFREKCGSCHNGNDKKGDLVLDNYGLAMQGGGPLAKSCGLMAMPRRASCILSSLTCPNRRCRHSSPSCRMSN